jgi:hypothetical protein
MIVRYLVGPSGFAFGLQTAPRVKKQINSKKVELAMVFAQGEKRPDLLHTIRE